MNPRQPAPGRTPGRRWQFHQAPTRKPGRCGWGLPGASAESEPPPHDPGGGSKTNAGRCPEVQGMPDRPTRSRRASSVSGASARSRSATRCPTPIRPRSSAGSRPGRTRSGATPTSCRSQAPRARALPTGWTPLVKADRLAERLGLGELYIKNETANPTHSFKDRVVSVALARARRARVRHARVCVDRQPRQRRRGARRGRRSARLRADPARPRGAEDPRHGRLRRADRRRQGQLRRRQPALHRGLGRAAGLGVREHQHAPVLRRGLQDARVRDRRAARLGAAGPDRRPDRLRLAVHEDRARLPGVHRRRPRQRRGADDERRPGRGLLAGRHGVRRGPRRRAARSSRTRSPSRWRSATRPTARTRSSSPAAPAAASTASTTTRSAPASACWPRRPASSPRPPAA